MDRKIVRRRERRNQDRKFVLMIGMIALALIAICTVINVVMSLPRDQSARAPEPTAIATLALPTIAPTQVIAKRIAIGDEITGTLRISITQSARNLGVTLVNPDANADARIGALETAGAQVISERVYVVADWFASARANITSSDLRALWHGNALSDGINALIVSDAAYADLVAIFGAPASNVKRVVPGELSAQLWANHNTLAILPFDALTPKLRLLALDNINLLQRDAALGAYSLVRRIYASGDPALIAALRKQLPAPARDVTRLTTVIMTGSSSIARTSAQKTDERGDPAFAARQVAEILASADLTHVSNEVAFTSDCKPVLRVVTLCSKPEYLAAFQLAGVDLVGLTGNHLLDYGQPAFLKTLDLYDANKMRYYGGGRNEIEARKILYVEHNGNRLAFLGANSFGPASVWATATKPGARKYSADEIKRDLAEARARADVVFIEFQAEETYEYVPYSGNRALFRAALDAGADVITGVQAHQPQALEFSADGSKIILYGLGNLFFDQMFGDNVRQGLVARHTIHRGRLIQTELLTTMLEDYVQPRWATPVERAEILRLVFGASGFK